MSTSLLLIILSVCAFFQCAKAERQQEPNSPFCKVGFFANGQGDCEKVLDCQDLKADLEIIKEMPGGFVKRMFLVKWKDMSLVYSVPRNEKMNGDFEHGLKMLEKFQGTKHAVELAGYCYRPLQILTKYYKYGSADNLDSVIHNLGLNDSEETKIRLRLAQDYLEIINFLHNSPTGCRVMCDSNSLNKTMSQFLISDDHHLLVSDIDALPMVDKESKKFIKCGHRQLYGSFVAPEQLWPYKDREFNDSEMPEYDEKTDIWKIPDVVFYLLGNTSEADQMRFMLFDVFKKCKAIDPRQRPNAKEILEIFLIHKDEILKDFRNLHFADEL